MKWSLQLITIMSVICRIKTLNYSRQNREDNDLYTKNNHTLFIWSNTI